jgi:hypothetical protein
MPALLSPGNAEAYEVATVVRCAPVAGGGKSFQRTTPPPSAFWLCNQSVAFLTDEIQMGMLFAPLYESAHTGEKPTPARECWRGPYGPPSVTGQHSTGC